MLFKKKDLCFGSSVADWSGRWSWSPWVARWTLIWNCFFVDHRTTARRVMPVNSQLVCLLLVGIFMPIMIIWNICFSLGGSPVNKAMTTITQHLTLHSLQVVVSISVLSIIPSDQKMVSQGASIWYYFTFSILIDSIRNLFSELHTLWCCLPRRVHSRVSRRVLEQWQIRGKSAWRLLIIYCLSVWG